MQEAARFRAAAIERLVQLDEDSALVLYRAARAADPDYFPAQYEYITLMQQRFRAPELRREMVADHSAPMLHACLVAAADQSPPDEGPVDRLRSLEARFGPSPCTDEFLLAYGLRSSDRKARVMRDSPTLMDTWSSIAAELGVLGKWDEADEALRTGKVAVNNPVATVEFALEQVGQRFLRGDTAGAVAAWQSLSAAVRRDGRPGPLAKYLSQLCSDQTRLPVATPESRSAACLQLKALLRTHHAWFIEWDTMRWLGVRLMEGGELTAAVPVLTRSVELADSAGSAGVRLIAYTARGRAFSKAGNLGQALRDLTHAVAVGPAAESRYYYAEAYHNLAHTYEGAGRFAEAAVAADSFAAIAAPLRLSSERWMSRYDAGIIRWEAGWHTAAKRDFDAMIPVVDEEHDGEYFAGESFERIGDLGRALEYYRAGAIKPAHEVRNLEALARVYEALGLPDSAEAAARQHDAETYRWQILDRPLLPEVLAKHGRLGEAVALADAWAHHELTSGNVRGAAIAELSLGELLLQNREPTKARLAAASADSLSSLLQLTAEAIEAKTLEGRALLAEGLRSPALTMLRTAVTLARAHPSTEALLATNLALGNALEATGQRGDALAAYNQAGVAVERMTAGLTADVDRTGFRSLHLAPFDGALRVLLRGTVSASDAEAALRWSARRKAAALALAGEQTGTTPSPVPITQLHADLAPDEALIDFTILDSTVAAIVVRRQGIAEIRLHTSPMQLANWIQALRRPLVATPGGRIDLAHAPFDAAVAESLFHALLSPLGPSLAGVARLAISPDGALWYVPFAALVTGRTVERPNYFIERYEIRLLPSASFLASKRGGPDLPPGFRVEALTYEVPGGAAELAAIRGALGADRVVTRDGPAATEHAAMNTTADVLHLAAHGVVDDRDPLASHIELASDGQGDGLLNSSEVASHRIVPRLVVLTACESVNGKLYAGEGLVSLARAFLVSGAHHVIASQWPVDASAAELTGVFYRELTRGSSPSAALRAAQLALLEKPETAHPIHWAGFVAFDGAARR